MEQAERTGEVEGRELGPLDQNGRVAVSIVNRPVEYKVAITEMVDGEVASTGVGQGLTEASATAEARQQAAGD